MLMQDLKSHMPYGLLSSSSLYGKVFELFGIIFQDLPDLLSDSFPVTD